jgi:hypothetical protein
LLTTAYPHLEAFLLQDLFNEQQTNKLSTTTTQELKKKCQTQLQPLLMPSIMESAFFNGPSNYLTDNMLDSEATASFAQHSSTLFSTLLPQQTINAHDFLNWGSPISDENSMNYALSPSNFTVSPVMSLLDSVPMMVSSSNSSTYSEISKVPIPRLTKKRKEDLMDRNELVRQVEEKRRRNTESARRSRERKALKMNELEQLLKESEDKRKALEAQVQQLLAEKQQLLLQR